MDVFIAALHVGKTGCVTGVNMTDEQLANARRLCDEAALRSVSFEKAYIEDLPFEYATFDVVISNGVIDLSPDKEQVFHEISRVLKPGGRVAISDIVTDEQTPDSITCDPAQWVSSFGGAMQIDDYKMTIEDQGLAVTGTEENPGCVFRPDSVRSTRAKYGVKSISLGSRVR